MKYSLPDSATDLLIKDGKLLMRSLSIYEVLRRFSHIIRLTPFRFEDFSAALLAEDQSALLAEIHIQLLKTLVQEDRQQQTWLGPPDIRDSVNIYLHAADHTSWPAALRIYLSADSYNNEFVLEHLKSNNTKCYPYGVDLDTRLSVIEQLCDQFLMSVMAREEIVNGNGNKASDKNDTNTCRQCLKPDGDLITCETCSGLYHLKCSDPPLDNYPDSSCGNTSYTCFKCRENLIVGVTDCISEDEQAGSFKRHESLGMDKLGRRFWFIARRLFVVDETEDDVRYYTYINELAEIIDNLHENRFEKSLMDNLLAHRDEMERQMKITENLYEKLLSEHRSADGSYSLCLGQDGTHRCYTNTYSSNNMVSNKMQPQDRDMVRSLNYKFCLTALNSFKWFGAIDGHLNSITLTIRTTLLKFETTIPNTFLHPCWQAHRMKWIRSINAAKKPEEFAKALTELEISIKPVLFRNVWYDGIGFTHLFRSTYLEREELKKVDRQPRGFEKNEQVTADFELAYRNATMVKFSSKLKPVKHQVWKQKGEKYRLTGLNGWFWMGKTRRSRAGDKIKSGFDFLSIPLKKEAAKKNRAIFAKPRMMPSHDFRTRKGKVLSIFVLPQLELYKLARSGGLREVKSFSYTAKQSTHIWPYGFTPRPTFRTCWLYRNQLVDSMQDISLQMRVFNACMRWDDLQIRPPASGHNTIVTDESTIIIELLKKRDKLPYLVHSEYLIRKTTTPNEQPTKYRKMTIKGTSKASTTPSARSGLRARRQVEPEEEKKPTREEVWVSEYQLELWELRQFDERIERQNALLRERALREEAEKRRRAEEEKRRSVEQQRRIINLGQDDATRNKQAPHPTTPVLRYFRTDKGQIIRLPADCLQRGTRVVQL